MTGVKGVFVGDKDVLPNGQEPQAAVSTGWRGLTVVVDAVLYLGILGFAAVAVVALALAAPLAIVATAVAGALSAMTARSAKRGGWRIAGV